MKSAEQRMRLVRFALEFRVILAGEKIRMIAQLDQFREGSIGRRAADEKTFFRPSGRGISC